MERSLEIVELLIAVRRLPEDRRRTSAWYESQKERWVGWLFNYNSPGAYGRKTIAGRDAKFVYNHVVCPELLVYLADACGVSRTLVRETKRIVFSGGSQMARSGAIRRVVAWETVQSALIENRYVRGQQSSE